MPNKSLKLENLERYYGTAEQVLKQIECCPRCGAKFIVTHLADHQNMYVHEEVKCPECNWGTEETLHILN